MIRSYKVQVPFASLSPVPLLAPEFFHFGAAYSIYKKI